MMARILRTHQVLARIGVSRSTLYEWMARDAFPASIPLGERSIGWLESDVDEWIEARARQARGVQGEAEAARTAV